MSKRAYRGLAIPPTRHKKAGQGGVWTWSKLCGCSWLAICYQMLCSIGMGNGGQLCQSCLAKDDLGLCRVLRNGQRVMRPQRAFFPASARRISHPLGKRGLVHCHKHQHVCGQRWWMLHLSCIGRSWRMSACLGVLTIASCRWSLACGCTSMPQGVQPPLAYLCRSTGDTTPDCPCGLPCVA